MSDAAPFDLERSETFTDWHRDVIRFSDQDSGGHVNNVSYAYYVEGGRVAFKRAHALEPHTGERFVVARVALDFRRETHYPGEVAVGTRVIRVGGKSFALGHGVFRDGLCLATAESTGVYVGPEGAVRIPDDVRAELERLAAA